MSCNPNLQTDTLSFHLSNHSTSELISQKQKQPLDIRKNNNKNNSLEYFQEIDIQVDKNTSTLHRPDSIAEKTTDKHSFQILHNISTKTTSTIPKPIKTSTANLAAVKSTKPYDNILKDKHNNIPKQKTNFNKLLTWRLKLDNNKAKSDLLLDLKLDKYQDHQFQQTKTCQTREPSSTVPCLLIEDSLSTQETDLEDLSSLQFIGRKSDHKNLEILATASNRSKSNFSAIQSNINQDKKFLIGKNSLKNLKPIENNIINIQSVKCNNFTSHILQTKQLATKNTDYIEAGSPILLKPRSKTVSNYLEDNYQVHVNKINSSSLKLLGC